MELNVIWISNISNADGPSLDPRWTKKCVNPPWHNDHIWPKKHHTSPSDWTLWHKFLMDLCQNPSTTLWHTLGPWHGTPSTLVHLVGVFCGCKTDLLYIRSRDQSGWKWHGRKEGRQQHMPRYKKAYVFLCDIPISAHNLYQVSVTAHSMYYEVHSKEWHRTFHTDSLDPDPLKQTYSFNRVSLLLCRIYFNQNFYQPQIKLIDYFLTFLRAQSSQ